VKSNRQCETDAAPAAQLAAEHNWLTARHLPGSFLATLPEPSPVERDITERVREILGDPRLVAFLRILEQHNSQLREIPGRRLPQKDHFLLSPHLHQVLMSVRFRTELRERLPVFDQPAAEVRKHLQKATADCKALATLIRKGPQPHVAPAGETSANEALKVFAPWTEFFEAADGSERQVVPFAELLERAATWFDALANHVARAPQNRHTGNGALRMRAAEFLPGVFRKRLGHPYHAYVGTIATIVSRIPTDADFVKKVEAQQSGSKQRQDGESLARKKAETLP
jgi:hypothetical protein